MVTVILAARQPLRVSFGNIYAHRPVKGSPTCGMAWPDNGIVAGQVTSRFFAWTSVGVGIVVINIITLFRTVIWWVSPPACRWLDSVCAMVDTCSVSRTISHFQATCVTCVVCAEHSTVASGMARGGRRNHMTGGFYGKRTWRAMAAA